MKKCFKCNKEKQYEDFYKHKGMSDGYLNKCKSCTKEDSKRQKSETKGKSNLKPNGVISTIYSTQKVNQKNRGHGELPYNKQELKEWLYKNNFLELYEKWVDSGFCKDEKPSVDRFDDLSGYSFQNMRLVTWKENRGKQYNDIKKGIGTSGKRCKRLAKLNSKKEIICEYVSYWSAVRDIGYSIEYQIKKGTKCRYGFYWVYLN
jgi:hypothetical protein